MTPKDFHVFVDADLDGAISYLTLCWFLGFEPAVTVTTEKQISTEINKFFKECYPDRYKRIYILDLDVCDIAEKIDRPNFSIVDHHYGSLNCGYEFKNAKVKIEDSGSTCKLLYKTLKSAFNRDVDEGKKLLISIGHDYDSYTLKDKSTSIGLNMLYWNLQGDRLDKFVQRYKKGFDGFTTDDTKIIDFYNNKLTKFISQNTVYSGTVMLGDKDVRICSIIADFCINEIAQEILTKTNSEIAIVVNTRSGSVSFRRDRDSQINVAKLAKKISNGGGHPAAAGGSITPEFLAFTKLLK